MSLKLHYHPLSTFSRRVLIAFAEKRIPHELGVVDMAARRNLGSHLRISPQKKSPAIKAFSQPSAGTLTQLPIWGDVRYFRVFAPACCPCPLRLQARRRMGTFGLAQLSRDRMSTQPSTSSDLRFNDAEPAPDVSLAVNQSPPAVATVNDRRMPLPPDAPAYLASHGRVWRALIDELIHSVGSVCMLYSIVFRYLPGGRTRISIDHPEEDYVHDDSYNNPEFYRKLR
jgi:hypothetical protein